MTYQQQRDTTQSFTPAVEVYAFLVVGGTVRIAYPGTRMYQIVGRITAVPPNFASSELLPGQVKYDKGPLIRIGIRERREIRLAAAGVKADTMTVMTDLSPDGWLFGASARNLAWSAEQMLSNNVSEHSSQPVRIIGDARSAAEVARLHQSMDAQLPDEADRARQISVQRGLKAGLQQIRGTLRLRLRSTRSTDWYQTTLIVDGGQVATTNDLSGQLTWLSTDMPDGEYVIEATARSPRMGYRRIRKRMLVLNHPSE